MLFNNKKNNKSSKKNTKNVNKKQQKKIKKTVQQTVPYYAVYPNGIIEIEPGVFTKTYKLQDVNYQTAKYEDKKDMFLKYEDFLNSFDPNIKLQISIHNRELTDEEFEDAVLLKCKYNDFDKYIGEYNNILKSKMHEGQNNITKDKYVTVSIECDSYDAAVKTFVRLDHSIIDNLSAIGENEITTLSTNERLLLLYKLYNPGRYGDFDIEEMDDLTYLKKLKKQGETTKDVVGPSSFKFTSNYFMVGDKYGQTLYMKSLPSYLSDTILSELTDTSFEMITSLNLKCFEQEDAIKMVKTQLQNISTNVADKQKNSALKGISADLISPELKLSYEETRALLDDITTSNQKLFLATLVITHFADSKEDLKEQEELIESTARKYLCQVQPLRSQQEVGLNSSLPLCNNQVAVKRTLTTESTAIFIPFTAQELFQPNGVYYGLNAKSRNLILIDRTSLDNGNGFVFGTPGAGKSFSVKRSLVNTLLATNDDVIVIDPENEYGPLAELLGGEKINIETGGIHYINPLDMDIDYAGEEGKKDPITLKSDFMISLCETIMSGNSRYAVGLTAAQVSIIDRCVTLVYRDYVKSKYKDKNGKEHFDESKVPTLLDFQNILREQTERDAVDLALALEVYTRGNLDIFSHKTNVDTKNRFLVYNIRDLGSGMQSLAMLIVLDSIWNRILKNKEEGRKTWVCIDESHLLVRNDTSANFLNTLYKRSRKYNALFTCITQNVSDFLSSETTKTMVSNSQFVLLLNQAALDREQLASLLNISETQCGYLRGAKKGSGLICCQNAIVPFKDEFPQNTKLYRVMTTKPSDIAKYKQEEEERKLRENGRFIKKDEEKKPEKELTRYEKSIMAQIEAQKEAQKKQKTLNTSKSKIPQQNSQQVKKQPNPQQVKKQQVQQLSKSQHQQRPQQSKTVKTNTDNKQFIEDIDNLDDMFFDI